LLDEDGTWSADASDENQWLEFDFANETKQIAGVVVQGRGTSAHTDQVVQTFAVATWNSETSSFVEVGGNGMRFYGPQTSAESDDRFQAILETPIVTQKVRILPKTWNKHISMRAGILVGHGCGQANGFVVTTTSSTTASTSTQTTVTTESTIPWAGSVVKSEWGTPDVTKNAGPSKATGLAARFPRHSVCPT
jgi:hypothetical protein